MSNSDQNEPDLDFTIEFTTNSKESINLIKDYFSDENFIETSAFTGLQSINVFLTTAQGVLKKLTQFIQKHSRSYKDAKIKIGTEEISLEGYSMEEVEQFLERNAIKKHLTKIKK